MPNNKPKEALRSIVAVLQVQDYYKLLKNYIQMEEVQYLMYLLQKDLKEKTS